jgi:hypothetical protein
MPWVSGSSSGQGGKACFVGSFRAFDGRLGELPAACDHLFKYQHLSPPMSAPCVWSNEKARYVGLSCKITSIRSLGGVTSKGWLGSQSYCGGCITSGRLLRLLRQQVDMNGSVYILYEAGESGPRSESGEDVVLEVKSRKVEREPANPRWGGGCSPQCLP